MKRASNTPRRVAPGAAGTGVGRWALLFTVAFILRVGYVWLSTGPGVVPYSDAADYDAIAWNLATGQGFSLGSGENLYPTAFRPPVVPWLTSLLYRAIGHRYFGAVLLQCAIGAFVPLLLAWFGAAVFGAATGLLAGWLAAFHPLLVFFSGYLLTETTFCAALLLALLATAEWIKTPRGGRAFGAGMLWGVATLTRPTAILLPGCVALWAWVPLGLSVPGRERARQILFVVLGAVLVVGPWTLRNAAALHAFVPVTTGGGRSFLDSNNEVVWSNPALRGGAIAAYDHERWRTLYRGLGEVETDRLSARLGWEFLHAHIREWPAMALAKLGRFWRLTSEAAGTGSWRRADSPLGLLTRWLDPLLFWSLLTLPLAIWGLAQTLRGPRRWFQALAVLVILYFSALAVLYWGALRMRVPIEPLVVLLSAIGLLDLRRRLRVRARGFKVVEGAR